MTFEQWLDAATRGLPASARVRLEREYAAHLEDSVACGESDTLSLLGQPEAVRQSLRRLYLSQDELAWRSSGYSIGMVVNGLAILAVFALTLWSSLARRPFWTVISLPALGLVLFGLAYLLTQRLERRQRAFVMDSVCVLLFCALPAGLGLAALPKGERLSYLLSGNGWHLAALLGLGALSLAGMFWHEKKLRRTLALGGGLNSVQESALSPAATRTSRPRSLPRPPRRSFAEGLARSRLASARSKAFREPALR